MQSNMLPLKAASMAGEAIVLSDGIEMFQSSKLGSLPSVMGGTTCGVVDGPEY